MVTANIDLNINKLNLPNTFSKIILKPGLVINNADKLFFEGIVSFELFQNKLLASSIEIKSNDNSDFNLEFGEINYQLNNFYIKANILESQLEIDKILINSFKDKIEIKGMAENIYNNISSEIDVNIKKIDLSSLNDFFKK